jgi:hypothetical protein
MHIVQRRDVMRSKLTILLLIGLLPFALACQTTEEAEVDDAEDTAPVTSEQEAPGTEHAEDLNPVEAQTMVDDVTIGTMAGADGMIALENQTDDFAPGEKVVLSMNVSDAAAGTAVKVAVFGPGEVRVTENEQQVAEGAKYLTFEVDTTGWEKGDYRGEVWIGDEKVNTQQFQVVDAQEAG